MFVNIKDKAIYYILKLVMLHTNLSESKMSFIKECFCLLLHTYALRMLLC